jgi:hypothetical protein
MSDGLEFPAKFVEGIVAHINEDHRDDLLDIARGIGRQDWPSDAWLLHADMRGLDMMLSAEGREEKLSVAFDAPLSMTTQFRPAMIALIRLARTNLNIASE